MAATHVFRESFIFGHKELTHWFPSHMARSMKKMQGSMKKVDCVVEVHDARLPFAGRNPAFRETFGIKPHLLILNKKDLADTASSNDIRKRLQEEGGIEHVMFTNCVQQNSPSAKKIVPTVIDIIEGGERFNRTENQEYSIMVVGIPNVGKSSLINALRRIHVKRGKGTKVGRLPGVTRSLMQKILVSEQPRMWLFDTPGITTPFIQNVEVGMKLAMMGTLQDHMVGTELIADYVLFTLNRLQKFRYVDVYNMSEPCDDIDGVLAGIARKFGKVRKLKTYEDTYSILNFVCLFLFVFL
ncbi:mitochondrial ribosome-associated GTPase 1 [Strongylocentrotus purpuratus]|uniref:Mitochondrial GTPase 1 n=1 Tax=Strongylocentrotus purpuratus TaxID=7668 RepID=A0A7M7PJ73_STRPU|nr:mitochondrial ribosome-associated GTPase 1 [Strongylocentrotus purpuratus]XP_030852734.1 mitochondrial ribosome-associated GTPase 1 [Strongylocentrotus purpuratus]